MAEEDTRRDRELENLLGQFLVSSFQSDKLAEMIFERLLFSSAKEVRMLLPQKGTARQPLLLTLRVEPYPAAFQKSEVRAGPVKTITVLESPNLEMTPIEARQRVQEIVEGSMQWWLQQGTNRHLRLEDWQVNVSVIDSKDYRKVSQVYNLLGNLEAKRKGEITR